MRYTITGRAAAINGGVLELTDAQVRDRLHSLKKVGDGRYEVVRQVEFKQGEEIGYDGDLPKFMATVMEPTESVRKVRASTKAKAE